MVKVKDNLTFFEAWAAFNTGLLIVRADKPPSMYANRAYVKAFGAILQGSFSSGVFSSIAQLSSLENERFSFGDVLSKKWESYALDGTFKYVASTGDAVAHDEEKYASFENFEEPCQKKDFERVFAGILNKLELPPFFASELLKVVKNGNKKEFD